ncbi:MAG TPA: hypothetical protein VGB53_02645 [Rubricoccaceae bacterium]|jgi:hypothetical protein
MRLIVAGSRTSTDAALVVVLAALVLSGCAPPETERWEVFESRFEQVQPGMTQSEVAALLGMTFQRYGHYVLREPDPEWGSFAWPGRPAPDALIDGQTYLAWNWRSTVHDPAGHEKAQEGVYDLGLPRTAPEWFTVYFDGARDEPRELWRVVAKHHVSPAHYWYY